MTSKPKKDTPSSVLWDESRKLSRRGFLAVSAALVGTVTIPPLVVRSSPEDGEASTPDRPETEGEVDLVPSVCLMCHSACGIRGKVDRGLDPQNGVLVKVDGNPYHPNSAEPDERLPYATDPAAARTVAGRNCVKSQAAVQTLYDPYRLKTPLKRTGPRGSGQWEAISWRQALTEIVHGGVLPDGPFTGLRDLWDNETDIDPAFPEFGKIANKLVFSAGRIEHGQKEFTDRIFKNGFGTANYRHDHTSICEVSHHTGGDIMSRGGDLKGARSYTMKAKHHWKPDIIHASYIVWFGSNPLEASFPMQALARKVSEFRARGGKMVVADPRFSNSAAKADRWLPVIPGTDAALALAMARRIIENGPRSAGNPSGYDDAYLARPHHGSAANPNGDTTATDATWLVKTEESPKTYLTAEEAGLGEAGDDRPVVWSAGAPAVYDAADTAELLPGPLTVNGHPVETVFELYKERVEERTIAEYAAICGVPEADIIAVADELAAAWKQGVVDGYRGPVQHTNGVHAMLSILALNTLLGNYDWKGGNGVGGGHLHEVGGKTHRVEGKTLNLKTVPDGVSPAGVPISRHGKSYETDAPNLFARDGYPAKRPWQPFNTRWNYQEILPSIADGYPYPIGALILYWNNVLYSTPAARVRGEEILKDRGKIPLLVVFDILVSETAQFADYILPDTTWLERFSTPHVAPAILTYASGVRQPLVGRFIESGGTYYYVSPFSSGNVALDLDPATGPQLLEDILIRLGKMLSEATGRPFPGVGANAFADGSRLDSAWDWVHRILENLRDEAGSPVPLEADVSEPFPDRNYILARGGVFEGEDGAYAGDRLGHQWKGRAHLYASEVAAARDSMTGEYYDGLPAYIPIRDLGGRDVTAPEGFPFRLVTYKPVHHAQARTAVNPWLMMLLPENFVEMNEADAAALGLKTGDFVEVTAPTGAAAVGKVKAGPFVRPGVVAVAHSFGHWQMGGARQVIDGEEQDYDETRTAGVASCPLMMADPFLQERGLAEATLQDPLGGSASFYDSWVRIEKTDPNA